MKKIQFTSLFLAVSLVTSLSTPVLAAGTFKETPVTPIINHQETVKPGEVVIEQIGRATYYLEKTDSYTLAIGLYGTSADCTIRYLDTNTIYSEVVPIESINDLLPATRNVSAKFGVIKDAILDGSLSLSKTNLTISNIPTTRASSSEINKIMAELYSAGWPEAYTNYLRGTKTQNGVTAKLYHTLAYSIQDYDYTFVVAKTTLSTLMAITGLPGSKVQLIISLALTVEGVWQTVKDINVGKFDTYAYENKNVLIGDIQPYWSGRTVKWTAIVGDIGAALTFDYENKHNDFDDNNAILDTGLRNYFNK